jgi:hypothetical protein
MLFILAALAAAAEQPATVPADPTADDPIVCHRGTSDVGTHMRPKKVCMHKSEWDYVEKQTRDQLQRFDEHHLDPGKVGGHRPQ